MRRIEAFVIVQAGDLDGVEFQTGCVIDELERLPLESADGVGVEAQTDGNSLIVGCGGCRGGGKAGR